MKKSGYKKFDAEDPVRPDLTGEYKVFTNLVVDPEKVGHRNIFRVKNIWER